MGYTVLARRYRSRSFDDVVGQEPIARTLRNAISSGRTAHAYLFCGTRGVGKTSMARIFARELNLDDELRESEEIGESILQGQDLDVIEIDGASNRGVQEARDLIAAAGLAPSRCRYRIYIIDEVHMLTTPAFNALLKTMEEPPAHVKFILCTTEPHKVPPTIQSRCQRFDFRAIQSAKIAEHLRSILKQEGVEADDEVIAAIARLGNGSMRDALSLLDRLLAGGETYLRRDDMEDMLGLPPAAAVAEVADAVAEGNVAAAIAAADALLAIGIAPDRALEELATTLRSALLVHSCGRDTELLELSDDARDRAARHAESLDQATLVHAIAVCDATSRAVRRGGSGRAVFDATIARLCMTGELAEAGAAMKGVDSVRGGTKKKRPPADNAPVRPQPAKTVESPANTLNPDRVLAVLRETAGLRRLAGFLSVESIEEGHICLAITKEGQEMARLIVGRREDIERALRTTLGKQVVVEFAEVKKPQAAAANSVEDDDLVKAARDLFDGSVVNVRDAGAGNDSESSSCP